MRTTTTSSRAVESTGRGASSRTKILDVAAELFVANGYSATTTREIAEGVGIRQPSLYSHFANKSEILLALLTGYALPTLRHGEELLADPSLSAKDRLIGLIEFDLRQLLAGRHDLTAVSALPEVNGPAFAAYRVALDDLTAMYERFVTEAVEHGFFTVTSIPLAASIVFDMVEGSVRRRDFTADPEEICRVTVVAAIRVLGEATEVGAL